MSAWAELIANLDIPEGDDSEQSYSIESEENDEVERNTREALDRNGVETYPPKIQSK